VAFYHRCGNTSLLDRTIRTGSFALLRIDVLPLRIDGLPLRIDVKVTGQFFVSTYSLSTLSSLAPAVSRLVSRTFLAPNQATVALKQFFYQ